MNVPSLHPGEGSSDSSTTPGKMSSEETGKETRSGGNPDRLLGPRIMVGNEF